MKNIYLAYLGFFVVSFFAQAQQHLPGGVPGAEIWYKATHDDLQNNEYNDFSGNRVLISPCTDKKFTEGLFNFNPSIAETFCLKYDAPLEEATRHDLFIVSEPVNEEESYRHISTVFNDYVPYPIVDSLSRNTYIIETKQGYASSLVGEFNQHQLANVHFYSWSNYDSDKKFKSYGQVGESSFLIGPHTPFPKLEDGVEFDGLFPEYISFDRQLTDNERNRVESYLAIKYGITLDGNRSYRNSSNKVVWDKQNNDLFGNNIFGIGRDDISGLNQLQCESAHNRDYLVAATVNIEKTNAEVQANINIANNNFLMFGDTGESGVRDPNKQNLRLLERVWLTQITGEFLREIPIHFRLYLYNEFDPYIGEIEGGDLVLWMLHDRHVDNSYVSEFDNGNVDYYKPVDIDFGSGYAHYKGEIVRFDKDHNFFDQYTFAVGPEIIIQVRYLQWQCVGDCFEVEIVVIGGEPEYDVELTNEEGDVEKIKFSHQEKGEGEGQASKFIYKAEVCGNQEYTVKVYDQNGAEAEYSFYVEERNHTLDLGPDQNLTAQQTSVLLDAGQGIDDPDATYQWFFNDKQIYHTGSTLDADQPGKYCVVVTTSDMSCQLRDCINITNHFECSINSGSGCSEGENFIEIDVDGGIPPYTTNISGNGLNFNHAHNGNTVITDLPYNLGEGSYTVTVTDSLGATCHREVTFQEGGSWGDLGPDQTLSSTQPTISLDGTIPFGNNPAYTYQWFRNGIPLSSTAPQLTVSIPGNYQLTVTFPDGCEGKAAVTIYYDIEGSILQNSDCDEASNTLEVLIDYGIPPYTIEIKEHPSGTVYHTEYPVMGSYTISGIPYGDYTVTVTDDYGGFLYQQLSFVGLQLNIHKQLADICTNCTGHCTYIDDYCSNEIPLMFQYGGGPCSYFTLDASSLNGTQNISYEWFMYGSSLGVYTPDLSFGPSYEICYGSSVPNYDSQYSCSGGLPIYTIVITDNLTGCSLSQSFSLRAWCPILDETQPRPSGTSLTTKVYPNPSDPNATFYYEVSSEEPFDGTVKIYDLTGSLIRQKDIQGKSSYTLPFDLLASGVYLICTRTGDTLTTDKIIIE